MLMHDYDILKLITEVVATASGCKVKDLYALGRAPSLCRVRETALYLIRQKTSLSYPEIGKFFTGRHHTTIISAVNHEKGHLGRQLPKRSDGRTLQEWHAFLLVKIDAAIVE
jgi:hypothetical protein